MFGRDFLNSLVVLTLGQFTQHVVVEAARFRV